MDRLQRVFSISGRVSRLGFWRFQVVQALCLAGVWCLTLFSTMAGGWLGLAPMLLLAPVVAAGVYVCIRRLHDRDRSAWWILPFTLAPYLLFVVAHELAYAHGGLGYLASLSLYLGGFAMWVWSWIEIGWRRGTRGPNRFGPPPASNRAWLATPAGT
jgi:uncharacterized membrane protein YhaH (DUF805 family)